MRKRSHIKIKNIRSKKSSSFNIFSCSVRIEKHEKMQESSKFELMNLSC